MYYTVFEQGSILDYIIELKLTRLEEVHKSCSEGGVGGHSYYNLQWSDYKLESTYAPQNISSPKSAFHFANI